MRSPLSIAFLLLAGCTALNGGKPTAIPQSGVISNLEELRAARSYWQNVGPDDYAFTLSRSCFCPSGWQGPFEVTVRAGVVTHVFQERRAVQEEELEDLNIPTINDLYALSDTAYVEGATLVELEVDPETGTVRSLFIDRDERIADEEIGITVTNYRPR